MTAENPNRNESGYPLIGAFFKGTLYGALAYAVMLVTSNPNAAVALFASMVSADLSVMQRRYGSSGRRRTN